MPMLRVRINLLTKTREIKKTKGHKILKESKDDKSKPISQDIDCKRLTVKPTEDSENDPNSEFLNWKSYFAVGDGVLFEHIIHSPKANLVRGKHKFVSNALCNPKVTISISKINKRSLKISRSLGDKAVVMVGTYELNNEEANLEEFKKQT